MKSVEECDCHNCLALRIALEGLYDKAHRAGKIEAFRFAARNVDPVTGAKDRKAIEGFADDLEKNS